jgi:RNA polymerase sigma factor (sigma-70 family)
MSKTRGAGKTSSQAIPLAEVYQELEDRLEESLRDEVDVGQDLTTILQRAQAPKFSRQVIAKPSKPSPGGAEQGWTSSHPSRALLRRAASGDLRAWDELVNRFTPLLWSVARAHRLDTPDAADAVQTTRLRLLEHLDRIEDPERLVGWLVTTMRRECLRTLRRTGRERLHASGEAFKPPDPAEAADAELIRAEGDAMFWAAFDRMPARCRKLLGVLMTSPPPSYEAVAAMLSMPIGSIEPTRQRCLQHLTQLLVQAETFPTSQAHRLTSDTE